MYFTSILLQTHQLVERPLWPLFAEQKDGDPVDDETDRSDHEDAQTLDVVGEVDVAFRRVRGWGFSVLQNIDITEDQVNNTTTALRARTQCMCC